MNIYNSQSGYRAACKPVDGKFLRYGGTSEFWGNPNFDAMFSSGFSLCVEILNIIFKTVNGHLIVHEHGIDTIFLIYYFE